MSLNKLLKPGKKILVTTKSDIKLKVVNYFFYADFITTTVCSGSVEQPFGLINGERHSALCAMKRIQTAVDSLTSDTVNEYQYVIAIENGICKEHCPEMEQYIYWDVCDVAILNVASGEVTSSALFDIDRLMKVPIPTPEGLRLEHEYQHKTAGQLICQKYELFRDDKKTVYDDKNWMSYFGVDRHAQIMKTFVQVARILPPVLISNVVAMRVCCPDFPSPGVLFHDYQKVFGDAALARRIADYFCGQLTLTDNMAVAGPELRGCILGPFIAQALKVPFVTIRKLKGDSKPKFPPPISIKEITKKEYQDEEKEAFYCDANAFKDKTVVFFDDILATGGSALACIELIEELGGTICENGLCFLADIAKERGTAKNTLGGYFKNVTILVQE